MLALPLIQIKKKPLKKHDLYQKNCADKFFLVVKVIYVASFRISLAL